MIVDLYEIDKDFSYDDGDYRFINNKFVTQVDLPTLPRVNEKIDLYIESKDERSFYGLPDIKRITYCIVDIVYTVNQCFVTGSGTPNGVAVFVRIIN